MGAAEACTVCLGRLPSCLVPKRPMSCLQMQRWGEGHVCHKGTLAHPQTFFVQSSFACAHAAHKGRKQLGGVRCGQGCNVQSCTSASEAAGISETAVAKTRGTLNLEVIHTGIMNMMELATLCLTCSTMCLSRASASG